MCIAEALLNELLLQNLYGASGCRVSYFRSICRNTISSLTNLETVDLGTSKSSGLLLVVGSGFCSEQLSFQKGTSPFALTS